MKLQVLYMLAVEFAFLLFMAYVLPKLLPSGDWVPLLLPKVWVA